MEGCPFYGTSGVERDAMVLLLLVSGGVWYEKKEPRRAPW